MRLTRRMLVSQPSLGTFQTISCCVGSSFVGLPQTSLLWLEIILSQSHFVFDYVKCPKKVISGSWSEEPSALREPLSQTHQTHVAPSSHCASTPTCNPTRRQAQSPPTWTSCYPSPSPWFSCSSSYLSWLFRRYCLTAARPPSHSLLPLPLPHHASLR